MITCQRLIFVYGTSNQKLKQNEETQDVDDMQGLSVLYMAQLEALSQQYYISCEGGL